MTTRLLSVGLAAILVAMAAPAALAGSVVDFTGQDINATAYTSTRGWEFDVTASGGFLVTDLGIWDDSADGLADRHDIGIWDSSGTLLVSATVGSGTSAPLDSTGMFRMVDCVDTLLAAATGYRIGAVYIAHTTDYQAIRTTGLTVDPSITFVRSRWENNGVASLTFPTTTSTSIDPGLFGPTFAGTGAVVPLPGTMWMGLGLLAVCGFVYWIRRPRAAF